ncbi:sensor histidine kinase [Methylotenera versatilis]|uniref:PAS/PAC sensor signal transduction histidine kinase n=1 Tax=Methylotenera versatilis (strain 301) TaxID=666681 RepID=D7DPX5_METV0|nr:sensor histidine kinase [Methylotenera versatilis]ADI29346.1 PAS/PAC sensor signal transduction histidine kinase [Methylotenera versatilis 301]
MSQLPDTSLLLDALLLGVTDEVYVLNISSMQLVYVSDSALKDTAYDLESLAEHSLDSLLGVSESVLKSHAESHRHHSYFVEILQEQAPIIGNIKHNKLRLMVLESAKKIFILIIKNDVTEAVDQHNGESGAKQVLSENETRSQTMVANTPGLVFQFQLDSNGEMKFIHLTDGCKALLGLNAEDLKEDSSLLYSMMNARDRSVLRKRLEQSTTNLSLMNWEGKVWIDGWQDNKWLDLRAVPRVLSNGVVQWEGIMTNITQSKNAKHEIEKSRRELVELTAHMQKIKEQERSAIAREIHDDLGGNLTAIKMGLSSIINKLSKGQDVTIEQAQGLESILDSTFEAVHRISSDLRPNVLDLGIVAALEWQAKEFEKQLGITCKFTCNQSEISVTTDQGITLFRIFQESMSNIAKHAKATHVSVDLSAFAHDIILTINDNGVGIKSSDTLKSNSFGLRGMRERVTALHGTFAVQQSNKQGTVITIKLPVE